MLAKGRRAMMFEPFRKYAVFSGRAQRKEYWLFHLFFWVMLLVVPFADILFVGLGVVLLLITTLALFIPSLAVAVRRLHDINKSGWWLLLYLIPFGFLVLLVFFCLDGTKGENRFGPDPKGRQPDPAVDKAST
jgi:uncharacterized membrane protein YhaH (DUF805 family)